MYTRSKYVVGIIDGFLTAVVVPETINHSHLRMLFRDGAPVSAGFCHYTDSKVCVYGESVSLRLKSNPEVDEELVGRAMSHPKYAY